MTISSNPSGWSVVKGIEFVHVMPIFDLRQHDAVPECWCCPTEDTEDSFVLIHHSADQREQFETGRRKPS